MALEPRMAPGSRKISVQMVEDLLARVEHLIEARPRGEFPVEWAIEAAYVGDIPAIAALAAIAVRTAEEQLLVVREFDLPRHLLFKAWTTPELVTRWWGAGRGEVLSAEIDLRVGGKWRYVIACKDGGEAAFYGEYREVVANGRIVWTEVAGDNSRGESVNTVMFTEFDGHTRLALLTDFASRSARDAAIDQGINATVREQMDLLEQVAASLR
jgi:uncharacterized protein YndB with AHSA1/START domain